MMKLYQRVLDGKGMLEDWKTSVMVPIYKRKGDVTNCGAYRGVKLLEHGMKIIVRVVNKRIRALVGVDDMQFGFMPGKGTTGALFIVRRIQEKYREKNKKLYISLWTSRKILTEFKKNNVMGTEEKRTTRDISENSDESV